MIVPIKTLVEQNRYEVDERRVADAIVARILAPLTPPSSPQSACSNPSSLSSASRNTTAG
jgi:hypothetical protein